MVRSIFALTSLSLGALLFSTSPPGSDPLKDGTGRYRFSRGLTPLGAAERCAELARRARSAWPDSSTEITSATLRRGECCALVQPRLHCPSTAR